MVDAFTTAVEVDRGADHDRYDILTAALLWAPHDRKRFTPPCHHTPPALVASSLRPSIV